eukprot:TRINITY_DN7908_c0_g1_i1.p1 TRINITY_DN7908_c0_g1~~TRINITY_DN7908_c0_g1_i1.p1  ORF type:complete len:329 (-),score=146.01 TRINITY_DN7908_c0_g1_i1:131-1117(-)
MATNQAATARKTFEIENNIQNLDPDSIFKYNTEEVEGAIRKKAWLQDYHYFKHVKISATALIKMVMHARSGGNIEVMGLLQGKIAGDTFFVMDTFALPVEGTETRVNAAAEAYEYMVNYNEVSKQVGRMENIVGWYHSHPGYGTWLSGIDVGTQLLNQQYQEPWLAIVVDPKRTISAGKVELGCFRTYPKDYKPPETEKSEFQAIPLDKIEDFGLHWKQYYQLDYSCFKSSLEMKLLDILWNKYWINTLSSSSLVTNRDHVTRQIVDLADKVEQSASNLSQTIRVGTMSMAEKKKEAQLVQVTQECCQHASEQLQSMINQVIKHHLFN